MSYPRLTRLRNPLGLLVAVLLCAACATPGTGQPPAAPAADKARGETPSAVRAAPTSTPSDQAQQELRSGIASYENGAYAAAARQLQSALAQGLDGGADQARAHKYLAFMHCASQRQRSCRDAFAKALAADPAFDLSPAEAGHPTWGPVFRKLKAAARPPRK
jgi:hypothetical protein